MSKDSRHKAEQDLKKGQLKALAATASMELGIDIGSVDLVVQLASPKNASEIFTTLVEVDIVLMARQKECYSL